MLTLAPKGNTAGDAALKHLPQAGYHITQIKEGKNPMPVMNNLRCKLLSRIFAVVNRQTPFVNINKFAA